MRSLLGRFHRPMSRGLVNNMLTMNNLGDGSTLSLDFTTMGGVLDPRLTFSRASAATFVNSSGYVEYAAHNLYYNTNFATISTVGSNPSLTGTGWSYALNSGTSFSATFNTNGSVTMSASAGRIGLFRSAGFAGTGRRLIFSVDITSVGDTGLPPSQLVNEGTKTNDAYYINGTLWTSGNVVGPCTLSFVFTSNPAGNAATYFGLGMSSNSTGVVTFANPRWGFYGGVNQLAYSPNTSATNANYLTAEYHAPRFDYSPTNIGEPRGLLIEATATNLAYRSNDFALTPLDGNNWNSSGYTADFTSTSLPDGSTGNARRLSIASGSGSYRSSTITVTESKQYTFSFWARNNGGSQARYRVWNVTAGSSIVDYNLSGSNYVASIGGANNTSSTWVRISVTFTTPAGCTSIYIYPSSSDSGTVDLFVWGAQLELGSGASSYIPTGASQVTRNTDSCLISGTNFSSWFNNTEGTCLFVGDNSFVPAASNFSTNWALISAANSMRINNYTRHTSGRLGASARDSGGTALTFDSPTASPTNITTTAVYKTAFALKTNDFAYSVNGNTVGLGDGNVVFETVTSIEFARDGIRNGHMKQFKFYPTRLSNAQLQTLTAP